jgi:hypothetical protein
VCGVGVAYAIVPLLALTRYHNVSWRTLLLIHCVRKALTFITFYYSFFFFLRKISYPGCNKNGAGFGPKTAMDTTTIDVKMVAFRCSRVA